MIKLKEIKKEWRYNPKINLSKEINLAAQMLRKDILEGITIRKSDIKGSPFKKLRASTVRSKIERKSKRPTTPLFDTGMMSNLSPISGTNKATSQRQIATVKVAEKRTYKGTDNTAMDVGMKHQEGINVPKREWFGIRKEMEKKINRMLRLRIKSLFKR